MSEKEECVRLMVHQGNDAALRDVSHLPEKEEFA